MTDLLKRQGDKNSDKKKSRSDWINQVKDKMHKM